jgi:hypothetical protein
VGLTDIMNSCHKKQIEVSEIEPGVVENDSGSITRVE